jgi:AcrR family transcriptional regulator
MHGLSAAIENEDVAAGCPRAPLSRARIVEAAIALMDAEGIGALTMRRLGDALSVRAMSIYKHFDNKEDVLQAVGEALYTEIEDGQMTGCPFEDVRAVMLATCKMIERHPYMTTILACPRRAPLWEDHRRRHAAALQAAGVSEDESYRGFGVMFRMIVGAASVRGRERDGRDRGFIRFGVDAVISHLRAGAAKA